MSFFRLIRKKKFADYIQEGLIAMTLLILALLLGIVGFVLIEDYTFIEAFYMSVITFSTVGYTEVRPLSDAGRIFSSVLILINIGIFAYVLSVLTSYVIEGKFQEMWQDYNIEQKINTLSDHIIICGYGKYGAEVADHFIRQKIPFVMIEIDEAVTKDMRLLKDFLFVEGDATNDDLLEEVGIRRARALISTLPDDAENVYVVLSARQLNPNLKIISRANSEKSERKLLKAGADRAITPEKIGGFYMATLVGKPDLVEFFQMVSNEQTSHISFEEIDTSDMEAWKSRKTIRELMIRQKTGASIVGVKKKGGEYIINPSPDTILLPGMHLIVLGSKDQMDSFKGYWSDFTGNDISLEG
ncbi:MAG: TrkA family potassium uptake protein [Chitinophagales bacterium]